MPLLHKKPIMAAIGGYFTYSLYIVTEARSYKANLGL